jgi:hypothetical protein
MSKQSTKLTSFGVIAIAMFGATAAYANFSQWDPNWSTLTNNASRAVTSAEKNQMISDVISGVIDTRGTQINVDNSAIETTSTGSRSVMLNNDMKWHNPFGTTYSNPTSTRWYQKDGNTQVFRVFPNDQNYFGSRMGAARSEAFADNHLTTVENDGKTMTFSARFHVAQHNGDKDVMLFQSKGRGLNTQDGTYPAWGISMWVEKDGDIILVKRNVIFSQNEKIDTGYDVGESFNLRVTDDGFSYKAFINNVELASGTWERGDTPTVARWGAYVQGGNQGVLGGSVNDAEVVYVSGARVQVN